MSRNHVIIYCRKSVSKADEKEYSLEYQERYCFNFAKSNKIRVTRIMKEIKSGYKNRRRMLDEIINEYSNITLLVYRVDRFSRNVNHGIELLETAEINNIRIIFVRDNLHFTNANPNNKDYMKILTELSEAEKESDKISQRLKETIFYKKSKGLYIGGIVPYGYNVENTFEGKKLIVNKYEQHVIDFIILCREDDKKTKQRLNKLLKLIAKKNYRSIKLEDKKGVSMNFMEGYMTFTDIAALLNEYEVYKRKNKWTDNMINTIYKNNTVDEDVEMEVDKVDENIIIDLNDNLDYKKRYKDDDFEIQENDHTQVLKKMKLQ